MSFSFKPQPSTESSSSNIDFDGFNQHLYEKIGSKNRIGIISGIIDLGVQKPDDFVEDFKDTKDQNKAIEEGRSKLETREGKQVLVTEQKPCQQIAISVDFPEVMIDYGKFFNEDGASDEKPYRHILNGEWWDKHNKEMILAKGYNLKCRPDDKVPSGWAYDSKNTISKLANAAGLVDGSVDQNFDLGSLLGQVVMFDLKAVKNDKFVNIKCINPSSKHEAIPVPEHNVQPYGVRFDIQNDPEVLKQLRNSVVNTMKRSSTFAGSPLEAQLIEVGKLKVEENSQPNEPAAQEPQPTPVEGDDSSDDDAPF